GTPAAGADEAFGPARGDQVLKAGLLGREPLLKFEDRARKGGARHQRSPALYPSRSWEATRYVEQMIVLFGDSKWLTGCNHSQPPAMSDGRMATPGSRCGG